MVTESGEGIPLVKIWVRKGARGVLLEPFEVDDPIQFINKSRDKNGRLLLDIPKSQTNEGKQNK
jgi:hypothetical protein